MINKILFATTNKGKIKEAREILGIEIEPVEMKLDEIQTLDSIECVEKKAETAYALIKKTILVEDTILSFHGLNGLPGVFIDYFMKTLGNEGLLRILETSPTREAIAKTSLCYYDGIRKITVSGESNGKISDKKKNKISMRKIALDKLRNQLLLLN